jgi:hypothetical protein
MVQEELDHILMFIQEEVVVVTHGNAQSSAVLKAFQLSKFDLGNILK